MEQEEVDYLLRRHEEETAAAIAAANQAVRVTHLELAFRYSVAAARLRPESAGSRFLADIAIAHA